jgi:hypothetical protein
VSRTDHRGLFRKGRAKTCGRKPGTVNQRTRDIAEKAASEGITPLEYMLAVMHDPNATPERRDHMAIAAAPFMHPRLAHVDAKLDVAVEAQLSETERRQRARAAILEAFAERTPQMEDRRESVLVPCIPVLRVIEHDEEPSPPSDEQTNCEASTERDG